MPNILFDKNNKTSLSPVQVSMGQRLFAWLIAQSEDMGNRLLEERKRRLFETLNGVVLEIGPGTGANLPYYPADVRWIGFEPNPAMFAYLQQKAMDLGLTIDLRIGGVERLAIADNSVDAVVGTLVLCSVDDPDRALGEIRRVLKPGGRFIFIEHVAAPQGTGLRRVQDFVKPVWKFLADGCRPNRETWRHLGRAGFESLTYDDFQRKKRTPITGPTIAGVAVKSLP